MMTIAMTELFDTIFCAVMKELHISHWYDLFDSSDFDIIERRIAKELNITVETLWTNKDYKNWCREMFFDL